MKENKLRFYAKKHSYFIGRKKLKSVTEWISTFFNKFDEDAVARKLKYIFRSKGINKGIREIKAEWKKKRNEGTLIHKEIQAFVDNDIKVEHPKSIQATKFIEKLFSEDFNGKEILACESEIAIYDEKLGLAGTIDLLLLDEDGNVHIIDWKTNTAIKTRGYDKPNHPVTAHLQDCNFIHYSLQLGTYSRMLTNRGVNVVSTNLVLLRDDDYEVIPTDDLTEVLEEMLKYGKDETEGKSQQKKSNRKVRK